MKTIGRTGLHTLFFAIVALTAVSIVTSCIPRADDEDTPEPPEVVVDSTSVNIDSTFVSQLSDIVGEWRAEYLGFDANPQQMHPCSIRRSVIISPDGTYDSRVMGMMIVESDSVAEMTEYTNFEHELGTYEFDAATQTITFHWEKDSLVNFRNSMLEPSVAKLRFGQPYFEAYTERVWFTPAQGGKRGWIRIDENLVSATDSVSLLPYRLNGNDM